MKAYLRVAAGFFAGLFLVLSFEDLFNGKLGPALAALLISAGLWYLALGKLVRDHLARVKAEKAAIAARADAGHAAFLAGDSSAYMAPPPEAAPRPPVRKGVVVASAIAAGFVLIAALTPSSSESDEASDTVNESVEPPAAAAPQPAQQPPAQQRGSLPSEEPAPTSAAPSTASAPPTVIMPNVMCLDLQVAQNLIQEAGVFYSRSTDATGRDRAQIIDSNWVVVGQTPAAGTLIGEGDAVLSVVKDDEPGDCS